jgi:hypothetical protein
MNAKRLFGSIIGTLIIGGLILAALADSISQQETTAGTDNSISETPSPPAETSGTDECTDAPVAVTMVRQIFKDGSASPAEVSLILNEAASMWTNEANGESGSKGDWLLKMSQLALDVDSYLLTGSPADGMTKFDQLFANMGLVDNFCS